MKGLALMYDYRAKVVGMIVSAIGILAMIAEKIWTFSIFPKLNPDQHYLLFLWCSLFGFFTMAFSKEKQEDERTKMIRYRAMQTAFYILISIMMSFTLVATLLQKTLVLDVTDFYILLTVALLMYLFLFHIGLYFDFFWEYEDKEAMENLRNIGRNKWSILIYLTISTLLCVALTFIF